MTSGTPFHRACGQQRSHGTRHCWVASGGEKAEAISFDFVGQESNAGAGSRAVILSSMPISLLLTDEDRGESIAAVASVRKLNMKRLAMTNAARQIIFQKVSFKRKYLERLATRLADPENSGSFRSSNTATRVFQQEWSKRNSSKRIIAVDSKFCTEILGISSHRRSLHGSSERCRVCEFLNFNIDIFDVRPHFFSFVKSNNRNSLLLEC